MFWTLFDINNASTVLVAVVVLLVLAMLLGLRTL